MKLFYFVKDDFIFFLRVFLFSKASHPQLLCLEECVLVFSAGEKQKKPRQNGCYSPEGP